MKKISKFFLFLLKNFLITFISLCLISFSSSTNKILIFVFSSISISTDSDSDFTDSNHQPPMKTSSPLPFITINENHEIHSSSDELEVPLKSRKFKLVNKPTDNERMNQVYGIIRFTYNKLVDIINDEMTKQKRMTLKELRQYLRHKCIVDTSELVGQNPWLTNIKNNLRDDTVKEVLTARNACLTQLSNGTIKQFKLHHKKKKSKSQSFYCRRKWITDNGDHLLINLNSTSNKNFCLKYKTER